ncbi:MAG: formate dehydrogenase subunit alpha [Candidatus Omnitrophota bacterium]
MVSVTINGKRIATNEGTTILEAALEHGIYIPHLCYHPDLEPVGVCRLCMVAIEGSQIAISCKTPVEDGMVVDTDSTEVKKIRKVAMELLLVNYGADPFTATSGGADEFRKVIEHIGITVDDLKRFRKPTRRLAVDSSNPFFERDPNKCILCGRCVRTCGDVQRVSGIDFICRGYDTKIAPFGNSPITESRCESCGECAVRCPTGALRPKHFEEPEREVKTTCPYCGVGCGFYLGVKGNRTVSVRADKESPVNRGSLCVKGRFGYDFVNHPDRLKTPLIKKKGKFVETSWDEAISFVADRFSHYKGEEFATFSSAKCTNEENYIIQKFARVVMGTNHIDHCARLCHSPTVAGLAQSFGSGAMTNSIEEITRSKCILAIGTNTTAAHPVIGLRVRTASEKGAKLIVANPKEIELCRYADIFLQQRCGSDVALLMGMMRAILDDGLMDKAFIEERCENFDPFKESLKRFTPRYVTKITGVPWKKIADAARIYATNKPASILYAMGLTQHTHGTDNVLATSNLALLTGNVGKVSSGVNPLRGQNNVQGACDMGALPNVYPGYQKVSDPKARKKFEEAWGVGLPDVPGLTHVEIFDAVHSKKIKALYIVGENPVLSEADANHVEEAIKRAEFIVVQDIFLSETAKLADVVLPACTFAEKDGTFTNTERRVQRVRKAIEPIGESKTDWEITCRIARKMGGRGFELKSASEIMEEIASLTPSYAGISYERIKESGLQWPCTSGDDPGTKFLHAKKFATKNGKGKFMPLKYRPPAEEPDKRYPFIFTTDRSLFHFHTSTMTRKVVGLDALNNEELLNINPKDARRLGLKDGDMVRVLSRRGRIKVKVKITGTCPTGLTSMTFHFAETPTNVLTNSALDPVAKIPETKVCAVRIEKI